MPEDTIASQGGAADTIPAGNAAIQPATPPEASSAELIPEAESGFTAEDFKNPQYGGKVKQLYRGWQKRMEEAKTHKKKAEDYEALIRYSPEVNKAVKDWWRKQQGLAPEDEATPAEGNAEKPRELSPADQVDAKLAFHSIYANLGQGDPMKGQEIFDRDYLSQIKQFLGSVNGKDPLKTMKTAMEYIDLKKGRQATPAPKAVVDTASSGERGGGTEQSAPPAPPKDAWDAVEQEARRQGYSSATAMFNAINKNE